MQAQTYVLLTAAHNEEKFIDATICSILAQDVKPLAWVIVSDASTDRTAEIIKNYALRHPFIRLVERDGSHRHNFAEKSYALRAGYERLKDITSDFIGILDADVTLEPDYYSRVLGAFDADPTLGVTGGFIYERKNGAFLNRPSNRTWSVAGAVQVFRREGYEKMGGIPPLRYGGEDWCAQVSMQAMGWTARANPELKVFHHRCTGAASRVLQSNFRQGRMEFSFGSLPSFEILKCISKLFERPIGIGAAVRFAGFVSSYFQRVERAVPEEVMLYLRKEQRERVRAVFGMKRIPSFNSPSGRRSRQGERL